MVEAITSNDKLIAELREQAPLVDRGYADQLMRAAADEIERRDQQLKEATDHEVEYMREIERLRAALERIASDNENLNHVQQMEIAWAALAGHETDALHGLKSSGLDVSALPTCSLRYTFATVDDAQAARRSIDAHFGLDRNVRNAQEPKGKQP